MKMVFNPGSNWLFLIGGLVFLVSLAAGEAGKITGPGDPQNLFVDTIRPDEQLQTYLETTVAALAANDPSLQKSTFQVALIDLSEVASPLLAHLRGEQRVYPASVIKFVYLMAAHHWAEENKIRLDSIWSSKLSDMIRHSSNQATRWVFYHLTGTEAGPELCGDEYRAFSQRRQAVKEWLLSLGVSGIHCIHPTFDGNGDLYGRDVQILKDRSFPDAWPAPPGSLGNRLSMTANATASLLAVLATGNALTADRTTAVLELMKRDVTKQKYMQRRIAGGVSRCQGLEVFAKTGTFRETFADAGIIRDRAGRQLILVVFIQNAWGYTGNFIPDLAERCARDLLNAPLK